MESKPGFSALFKLPVDSPIAKMNAASDGNEQIESENAAAIGGSFVPTASTKESKVVIDATTKSSSDVEQTNDPVSEVGTKEVVATTREAVEEILLKDDSYNEKTVITEQRPEWKATASTSAVSNFFAEYTAKRRAKAESD